MSGARSAVIQLAPGSLDSATILALVIIGESPTKVISSRPKRSRTDLTASMNALGSPVLPVKTSTAIGRPSRSVSSPYSI